MQETKEDFEKIIADLKEFAVHARNSSTRFIGDINLDDLERTLIEASEMIENLADFSVNLVDDEGNVILQIPDEQARLIMFSAVDSFVTKFLTELNDEPDNSSLIVPGHIEEGDSDEAS